MLGVPPALKRRAKLGCASGASIARSALVGCASGANIAVQDFGLLCITARFQLLPDMNYCGKSHKNRTCCCCAYLAKQTQQGLKPESIGELIGPSKAAALIQSLTRRPTPPTHRGMVQREAVVSCRL